MRCSLPTRLTRLLARFLGSTSACSISSARRARASSRFISWVRKRRAAMTISPFAVIRLPASALSRWNTAGSRRSANTSSRSCTAVATLLTFCPPGPEAAMKLSSTSARARAATESSSTGIAEAERGELGGPGRCGDDRRLAFALHLDRHRMQHRAPGALAVAIDRIAEQRDADARGRVDAQLVRAAGDRAELDQRAPAPFG